MSERLLLDDKLPLKIILLGRSAVNNMSSLKLSYHIALRTEARASNKLADDDNDKEILELG